MVGGVGHPVDFDSVGVEQGDRASCRLDRSEQAQHRIEDAQQDQNAKLDAILAALRGAETSE
jgi:hypothetical protein